MFSKFSILILALFCGLAPLQAAPHLLGSARGQGAKQQSQIWLGGGYFPGQGFRTDDAAKAALFPGTRWQLFGLNGPIANVTTGALLPPDMPVGYAAAMRQPLRETEDVFAVSNVGPDAQPRLPRAQNLNSPLYQKVAAAVLREAGLPLSSARLNQLLRVDLNGDGTEEVLLSASSRPDYGHTSQLKAGDYSLVALRFVDGGRVKNVPLDLEFSTKNVGFSSPGHAEILACVDVTGDGQMEIVVSNGYYEGWGFEVWQFDGKSLKRVAQAGWGV